MSTSLKLALAQTSPLLGDVAGNARRIMASIDEARAAGAGLVVFPQLALSGRPPADLLFEDVLHARIAKALDELRTASQGIAVLLGHPQRVDGALYDTATLFAAGQVLASSRRRLLDDSGPCDDHRYFQPGAGPLPVQLDGLSLGIAVGADVLDEDACRALRTAGAGLIVAAGGLSFVVGGQAATEASLAHNARAVGLPIALANLVGGQDELVHAGGSCLLDADGRLRLRAPAFETALAGIGLERRAGRLEPLSGAVAAWPAQNAEVYQALVRAVRDYVAASGCAGVVLGLSGGIDSALVLAIAVDALGAQAVQAVMLPYRYTSAMSLEDAAAQAQAMGVDYRVLPIGPLVGAARGLLGEAGIAPDAGTTAENLQARSRALLLMAFANQGGRMVLSTSNKSELAMGYTTLYGDMAGGFAPLKDCTKTRVYALARHRNSLGAVIPERVIARAPSAELRPDQQDSDSLPPYAVLDPILDALMLERRAPADIVAMGFEAAVVQRVLGLLRRAEHKRRQAPPGPRIGGRAFGSDWRQPLGSAYRDA